MVRKVILWQPWIEETQIVIIKTARWFFAALILTFLVFANIAAILTIVVKLKELTS